MLALCIGQVIDLPLPLPGNGHLFLCVMAFITTWFVDQPRGPGYSVNANVNVN